VVDVSDSAKVAILKAVSRLRLKIDRKPSPVAFLDALPKIVKGDEGLRREVLRELQLYAEVARQAVREYEEKARRREGMAEWYKARAEMWRKELEAVEEAMKLLRGPGLER
jgi:hypothetical protein